jgi:hypothetical protein
VLLDDGAVGFHHVVDSVLAEGQDLLRLPAGRVTRQFAGQVAGRQQYTGEYMRQLEQPLQHMLGSCCQLSEKHHSSMTSTMAATAVAVPSSISNSNSKV